MTNAHAEGEENPPASDLTKTTLERTVLFFEIQAKRARKRGEVAAALKHEEEVAKYKQGLEDLRRMTERERQEEERRRHDDEDRKLAMGVRFYLTMLAFKLALERRAEIKDDMRGPEINM